MKCRRVAEWEQGGEQECPQIGGARQRRHAIRALQSG